MIFKQRVLQDTKDPIHILSMLISLLVVGVLIICVDLNVGLKSTIISLMVILVIGMLCILIAIKDLEWFIIYKDRIEVKTIYHIRNIVYFKDVVFIGTYMVSLIFVMVGLSCINFEKFIKKDTVAQFYLLYTLLCMGLTHLVANFMWDFITFRWG